MEEDEVYDYFIERELFTDEEINLVTDILGYSMETFDSMIYARFGYQTLEQYLECEDEEVYNEYFEEDEDDE